MKLKILSFVLVCLLLLVDCGTKFNDAKASSIIKEAFGLTKYDTLEILEIFMESENIAEVKFKLNEIEFSSKMKRYVDKGWHLDKVQQDNLGKWFLPEDINILCVSRAVDFIKKEFELTEEESLKILGFTTLSTEVVIVKFKINAVQLRSKFGWRDNYYMDMFDFQNELGEIVNPKEIAFNEPSRLKKSMKNITVISTAIVDYFTDNGVTPTQDGQYDAHCTFYDALAPFYVRVLPIKDLWGNNYLVYCGKACDGVYGISGAGSKDFIVVSYGRDGEKETWEFDSSDPEAGLFILENAYDFDKDLIIWNGSWIRAPKSHKEGKNYLQKLSESKPSEPVRAVGEIEPLRLIK